MSEKDRGELLFLIKAFTSWLMCAAIMCLFFALIICKTSLESSYIGYISSFISFGCAVVAGYRASKSRKGNNLYTCIYTSLFLIILLLTIGFVIGDNNIKSSSIISVSSFSFAGVMMGSNVIPVFFSPKSKRKKNSLKGLHS